MTSSSEHQDILQSLLDHGSEQSVSDLLARHPALPRRTAQRLLAGWVEQGLLERHGMGPATRYAVAQPEPPSYTPQRASTFPEDIPLSPDSRDVLAYVSRPITGRHPIGYDDDFLDRYDPAHPYLSATLRRQLRQMGELGEEQLPGGTYGRDVLDRLLIDLSWSSSRLEGNTYSRLDTIALIERGELAEGKSAMEAQMILNHKAAIEFLVDGGSEARLDAHTVMGLHGMLSEGLLPKVADEGRLRRHAVLIGQSVYRPLNVPQKIEECFHKLLSKAQDIADPFEQAFFLLVHLPYLQPFADVNKRVSRVVANLPLIRANLCPLTFVGVPELAYIKAILGVYEMTRVELLRDVFMWAYEHSTREFVAVKRQLVAPDPTRLKYRLLIKELVRDIVLQPEQDAFELVHKLCEEHVQDVQRQTVMDLVTEELRCLHEGVLVRYGLRPSQLETWVKAQSRR